MSEEKKPKTIWDLSFKKKKAPTLTTADDGASSSSAGATSSRKRGFSNIKEEMASDDSGDDMDRIPGGGDPKLGEEVTERLRKRRAPRPKDPSGTTTTQEDLTTRVRPTSTRKVTRGDMVLLRNHAELIQRVLGLGRPTEDDWQTLRETLWEIPFNHVDQKSTRNTGILAALKRIEDDDFGIPEDIVLDTRIIRKRWMGEDFDPELLRGVDLNQTVKRSAAGGSRGTKRTRTYKLEDRYVFKKDPQVEGHNGLLVGEWWPLQICALRDGAHGELEAGISGNQQQGCLSVIVSSGGLYPDLDELDRVLYCGTMGFAAPSESLGADYIPSANTNLMLLSYRNKTRIRLLRSSKAKSPYAPVDGLRYDGLYTINSYEVLDKKTAIYRFEMIRDPDQPTIRGSPDHPGAKPNAVELKIWKGIQRTLKGER